MNYLSALPLLSIIISLLLISNTFRANILKNYIVFDIQKNKVDILLKFYINYWLGLDYFEKYFHFKNFDKFLTISLALLS